MSILHRVASVLLSAMLAASCLAQSPPDSVAQSVPDPAQALPESLAQFLAEPQPANIRGFTFSTSMMGSHDSFSGWSSVMDSSVRYDFNRVFGVELGVPYYMMHKGYKGSMAATQSAVTPPLVSAYNTLGDTYLRLHFAAPKTSFHYAAMITGTAPTGDTSSGISTGRPTFDLNNHIEHTFGFFTPMAEFGIGDSSALIDQRVSEPYASLLNTRPGLSREPLFLALVNQQIRPPYTTLGPISHYRVGATFDFLRIFSFSPSAYEYMPIGNQKVYSHLFIPSKTGTLIQVINGRRVPGYESVRELKGQGILEDNGLTAEMTVSLNRHMALVGTYQRSLRFHLDMVAFGMSFTFGRATQAPQGQ